MTQATIFQIFYSEETRKLLDPGFTPLDNLSNERPDWREYWPIRRFLKNTDLREDEYYGFLSPKFNEKTGLSSQQVKEFIDADHDVISFSLFFDQSAFYLNIFEQGEEQHPGLVSLTQRFLREMGYDVQLKSLVMDSRHVIFSNYFVAKASFWRRWLEISEKLFDVAEAGPQVALRSDLNNIVPYLGNLKVSAKVFIVERLASLILAIEPIWRVKPYNSFLLPSSHSPISKFVGELILLDALKLAYNTLNRPQYGQAFTEVRNNMLRRIQVARAGPGRQI